MYIIRTTPTELYAKDLSGIRDSQRQKNRQIQSEGRQRFENRLQPRSPPLNQTNLVFCLPPEPLQLHTLQLTTNPMEDFVNRIPVISGMHLIGPDFLNTPFHHSFYRVITLP